MGNPFGPRKPVQGWAARLCHRPLSAEELDSLKEAAARLDRWQIDQPSCRNSRFVRTILDAAAAVAEIVIVAIVSI